MKKRLRQQSKRWKKMKWKYSRRRKRKQKNITNTWIRLTNGMRGKKGGIE